MNDGMNPGFVEAYNARGEVQTIPEHWLTDPVIGAGFTKAPPSQVKEATVEEVLASVGDDPAAAAAALAAEQAKGEKARKTLVEKLSALSDPNQA